MTTNTIMQNIELIPLDIAPFVVIISLISGLLGSIKLFSVNRNISVI